VRAKFTRSVRSGVREATPDPRARNPLSITGLWILHTAARLQLSMIDLTVPDVR